MKKIVKLLALMAAAAALFTACPKPTGTSEPAPAPATPTVETVAENVPGYSKKIISKAELQAIIDKANGAVTVTFTLTATGDIDAYDGLGKIQVKDASWADLEPSIALTSVPAKSEGDVWTEVIDASKLIELMNADDEFLVFGSWGKAFEMTKVEVSYIAK